MKLDEEIFGIINESLIYVSCDNCGNEDTCPINQRNNVLERGGTCDDWSISDKLNDYITNRIINAIEEKLR